MNLVWFSFEILNKLICYLFVVNHKIRMNDICLFVCLFVIPKKNLLFSDIFNCIHFLKFNSSINLSFFARSEQSMYIKDLNSACISISSHSRAARFSFLFGFSRLFSSFVFCYQKDVLDFLMSMSIPSLPHCIYQSEFWSYTYVFQCLPPD